MGLYNVVALNKYAENCVSQSRAYSIKDAIVATFRTRRRDVVTIIGVGVDVVCWRQRPTILGVCFRSDDRISPACRHTFGSGGWGVLNILVEIRVNKPVLSSI